MKLIELTQGMFAKVDDADFDWLNQWNWQAHLNKRNNKYYAYRRNGLGVFMHKLILGITDNSILGDHINLDSLDNQRHNLRKATYSQNNANRSRMKDCAAPFRGVYKHGEKWKAPLRKNNESIYLGLHDTPAEAALAYNKAAKEHHGEFARLNEI